MSDTAVRTIEPFQPYHGVSSTLTNPLELLQVISNADKHRTLAPALSMIDYSDITVSADCQLERDRIEFVSKKAMVTGKEPLLRILVSDPSARIRVQMAADPPVRFFVADLNVVLRIEQFTQLVDDIIRVIDTIASLFPPVEDIEAREREWATPGYGGAPGG
jgi:hypothetical protein